MGNNLIQANEQDRQDIQMFKQKLLFVIETNSPNFGRFKVYKMLQKPYEYIMCKTYSSLVGTSTLQNKKQKYMKIPKNKSIIGFDYLSVQLVEQKCSKHVELNAFCRYYFFTLEEAIVKKAKKQQKFSEEEVLYVAKTLVSMYDSFHETNNLECQLFKTQSLFLSPEGFLKVYPQLNEWRQEGNEDNISLSNSIFAFVKDNEVEVNLTKDKEQIDLVYKPKNNNDLMDIGVVLLSLINTAKQKDYLTNEGQIKREMINFVLNQYNDPENRSLHLFKDLLRGILLGNWCIQQVKQELKKLQDEKQIRIVTRIKIIGNEGEDNDQTTISDNLQRQREQKLKMMPKHNLVPGKIQCLSSRKNGLKL